MAIACGSAAGVDMAAQEAQGDLDRVGRVRVAPGGVVRLDLEEFDADEAVVGPVGAAGQAVPLGPLAGQGGVGPAQVRAVLGVVGQQDLRGVAVDRPLLGALGLAVVGEVGVGLGQGAPGGPAGQDERVRQFGPDQADRGQGPGHPVGQVGVGGRGRMITAPGRRSMNQSTILSMSPAEGW